MRLYVLPFGRMQPGNIPVAGYLVQTDDRKNVLIDTGWPRSYVEKPKHPPGLTLEINPEDVVTARLASIGITPSDIDVLICSHLDDDHSGNHDLFKDAELVIQRTHYELPLAGHPRFTNNRDSWNNSELNYRLVDGDVELVPGIQLLETSGHVPGHQSIVVRLPNTGPVVLAIDAVMDQTMASADTRRMWVTDWVESPEDEALIRASTRKIADVAARSGTKLVIYGHDARQWPGLRLAPDYYD